jgi:hypothetical protein
MNEGLIEQVVGAYRETGAQGEIVASPAWHDLEPAERAEAFERSLVMRGVEAALDADGLSSTVRAVLGRLAR